MRTTISSLWQEIEPLVRKAIGASISAGNVATHALSGAQHTGTLADDQAPQFLLASGGRMLTGNLVVGPGITIDGVSISTFKLAYDTHVLNPNAHHAAFIGLRDATSGIAAPDTDQRIRLSRGAGITTVQDGAAAIRLNLTLASPSGLAIDGSNNLMLADSVAGWGLTISGKVMAVGAGDGITVTSSAVNLTTPGTLSHASTNVAAGSHTHVVTASSNPGAAASLLRTAADGNLTLFDLDVTTSGDRTAVTVTNGMVTTVPHIQVTAPAATGWPNGRALASQVSSDAHPRLALYTNGAYGAGSGAARPDVFWDRVGVRTWRASGDMVGAEPGNIQVLGWGAFGGAAGGDAALETRSQTIALRLSYDASPTARADLRVGAGGNLTVQPTGHLVLNPDGAVVRPETSYATDLGTLQRKWLSIHGAELWVETLVAQNTIATIGGRVLVGPTTQLVEDLESAATAIRVKYNNLTAGDTVYMEADGKVEFMAVVSGPTEAWPGPYTYQVTRNLDGTGANDWAAGDAVFNTGRAGSGFMDLYSFSSMSDVPPAYVYTLQVTGGTPWETGAYSANRASDGDYTLWTRTQVGDAVYFGVPGGVWSSLAFTLITPLAQTGGALAWEFWNGTAWTALTVTETGALTQTGAWSVAWTAPGTWQTRTINTITAYWVRLRWTTAPTTLTALPRQGGRRISRGRRQYGPTILGNVRNSATYNDWSEHWAVGNLSGTYDYGTDTYGFAAGRYSTTTPWLSADDVQGVRIMRGSVRLGQWDTSGNIIIGRVEPGEMNALLSAGELRLRVNTQAMFYANPGYLSITQPGDPQTYMALTGQQLSFFRSGTQISRFGSDMVLWDPADTTSYLQLASSEIRLQSSGQRRVFVAPAATRFGENTTAWATTRLTIAHTSTTIGEASESVAAGTVMFGRNASGQANMRYNASNGRVEIRGGTTTHVYADSTGLFAGDTSLTQNGVRIPGNTIESPYAWGASRKLAFTRTDNGQDLAVLGVRSAPGAGGSGLMQFRAIMESDQVANDFILDSTTTRSVGAAGIALRATHQPSRDASDARDAFMSIVSSNTESRVVLHAGPNLVGASYVPEITIHSVDGTRVREGLEITGRPAAWLGGDAPWTTVWRVGNANPFATDTNMLELVPHSWGDGFSLLFNAYSVDQVNAITAVGNTKRSHAHGGGGTHAAPAIINYDGNGRRWYFAVDTSTSGSRGANTAWAPVAAFAPTGNVLGSSVVTDNQRLRSISHNETTGSFPLAVVQSNNSTSLMYIRGDGQAWVNQAWTIGSDASLKRDIRPLDGDPLALLETIPVRRYRRAERPDGPDEIGVIAQELEEAGGILAELVSIGGASPDEATRGVDYTSLAMLTLAAVQRLSDRVKELERRFA
jgi:hypothetical protein